VGWLRGRKGNRPVKIMGDGGGGHWALVSLDIVSASVNLSLHHEMQKFYRLTRVVPEKGP